MKSQRRKTLDQQVGCQEFINPQGLVPLLCQYQHQQPPAQLQQRRKSYLSHLSPPNFLSLSNWSTTITNKWILETVQRVYSIQSDTTHFPSLFRDPSPENLLRIELCPLLEAGAIEKVPRGFYSRYFDYKEEGRLRYHLRPKKVKLFQKIHVSSPTQDWFTSLDLQDMYFQIAIRPSYWKYFGFCIGGGVGVWELATVVIRGPSAFLVPLGYLQSAQWCCPCI